MKNETPGDFVRKQYELERKRRRFIKWFAAIGMAIAYGYILLRGFLN